MKRVIISLIMLLAIAGVSIYSLYKVNTVHRDLNQHIDAVINAIAQDDSPALEHAVAQLSRYWKDEERKLIHLLRHAQVDEITKSMSRLEALARYREDAHLLAELDSIRWQMEHIWESEPPTLQNLF